MRPRYEVFRSERSPAWYWRLRAANGEPVALSEAYTRKEDAERGAKDARRASRLAKVTDAEE